MRKWKWHTTSSCLTVLMVILTVAYLFGACTSESGDIYETDNIEHYGIITGNYDNDTPKEFINSFFPVVIEENFLDVTYHYKAKKGDTYAFEAYLEFTIADASEYAAYVSAYVETGLCNTFAYDESFKEYAISNEFVLVSSMDSDAENGEYISIAKVGKVLFSDDEQRVIYVAIGMHDGGGATTKELGSFFERFNIDPTEYEKQAWLVNQ